MVPYSSDLVRIAKAFFDLGAHRRRKRKRPWLKIDRQRLRLANIMNVLESDDLRLIIDTETFDELLQMVRPYMPKKSCIMNQSVTAEERLIATLLYLTTGRTLRDLKDSTLLCPQLLAKIIPETCSAIFEALGQYFKVPKTEEEWKAVAKGFEQRQFNNCVGCLDARHILIKRPAGPDGSKYMNHDGTYSIIFVVLVNAYHEFLYVEAGFEGRFSSTLLPQCSRIIENVIDNDLHFPESCPLPGTDQSVPYVFIGDGFWPVDTNIMSPYLGEQISDEEKIFNYRLIRANTAANTLGILASNFTVLNRTITLRYDAVNQMVLAICALHNFLIRKSCYNTVDMFDLEDTTNETYRLGDWSIYSDPLMTVRRVNREPWNDGEKVRNDLKNYFSAAGRLPFQEKMMNVVPCIVPFSEHDEQYKNQ